MKRIMVIGCLLAVASVVYAGDNPSSSAGQGAEASTPPPIPATPAAVDDLVYARPFKLNKGYVHYWSKARPNVTGGTLLVIKVDPALVYPRQVAEPVLYVGDQTAQRINVGDKSGQVVAVVPGEVDLTKAPIWFGQPDLPERVDGHIIKAQRKLADGAGIKPFSKEKVQAATAKGGDPANYADLATLMAGPIADLILEYSPQEKEMAESFRVPVGNPAAKK